MNRKKKIQTRGNVWALSSPQPIAVCCTTKYTDMKASKQRHLLLQSSVSLQLKCGFLPSSDKISLCNSVKKDVCRFCMHKYLKVNQFSFFFGSHFTHSGTTVVQYCLDRTYLFFSFLLLVSFVCVFAKTKSSDVFNTRRHWQSKKDIQSAKQDTSPITSQSCFELQIHSKKLSCVSQYCPLDLFSG